MVKSVVAGWQHMLVLVFEGSRCTKKKSGLVGQKMKGIIFYVDFIENKIVGFDENVIGGR